MSVNLLRRLRFSLLEDVFFFCVNTQTVTLPEHYKVARYLAIKFTFYKKAARQPLV